MDCAQLANVAASSLLTLASVVFAAVYHLHAPWRSTVFGRHVMTFTVAIGLLALYTVLITLWPDGTIATVLRWLRTGLLVVIAVLVIQRTRMVLHAQHHGSLLPAEPDPQNGRSSP